jgi:hypothetical protein
VELVSDDNNFFALTTTTLYGRTPQNSVLCNLAISNGVALAISPDPSVVILTTGGAQVFPIQTPAATSFTAANYGGATSIAFSASKKLALVGGSFGIRLLKTQISTSPSTLITQSLGATIM